MNFRIGKIGVLALLVAFTSNVGASASEGLGSSSSVPMGIFLTAVALNVGLAGWLIYLVGTLDNEVKILQEKLHENSSWFNMAMIAVIGEKDSEKARKVLGKRPWSAYVLCDRTVENGYFTTSVREDWASCSYSPPAQ